MNDIRTYHVGNGEITLTAQDANELRKILQFEYIEGCIENVIENNPDCFHFTSEHPRSYFVEKVAGMHDDMVDMWGCYGENLDETVFHVARHVGVSDEECDDADDYSDFWKE